jgi:UDP-N-acetylglucosamine diphosphorylase / glucose-1-phosphate thymidylyltransferase / UDP-N-acetylgalactosamine diphosphorylase / glucosamine-1-phosphate N-acetyltransferase / galactosamine-1-phosphate N-acetyltransferase
MAQDNFYWAAYIKKFSDYFSSFASQPPWLLTSKTTEIVAEVLSSLSREYKIVDGIAIHKTAKIESNVTVKAPAIIGPNSFIAANCYLRGGVFLLSDNSIGPGCEIKSSFIFPKSNLAHFNFIGDSIIGSGVNFEAGSITANYYNERANKEITVLIGNKMIDTHLTKFGALVGDGTKIGANAVLSPGTILPMLSIVKRLELVEQAK